MTTTGLVTLLYLFQTIIQPSLMQTSDAQLQFCGENPIITKIMTIFRQTLIFVESDDSSQNKTVFSYLHKTAKIERVEKEDVLFKNIPSGYSIEAGFGVMSIPCDLSSIQSRDYCKDFPNKAWIIVGQNQSQNQRRLSFNLINNGSDWERQYNGQPFEALTQPTDNDTDAVVYMSMPQPTARENEINLTYEFKGAVWVEQYAAMLFILRRVGRSSCQIFWRNFKNPGNIFEGPKLTIIRSDFACFDSMFNVNQRVFGWSQGRDFVFELDLEKRVRELVFKTTVWTVADILCGRVDLVATAKNITTRMYNVTGTRHRVFWIISINRVSITFNIIFYILLTIILIGYE